MSNNSILKSGSTGKSSSNDKKSDIVFKTLSRIVDTKLAKNITSDISLNNNGITNVKEPVNDNDVATKGYCVSKNGDSMTGDLNMNNNRLINVGNPVNNFDCITREYFDTNSKLGNQELDMHGNSISNVKLPLNSSDVTNKLYVLVNGVIDDDTLVDKLCKIGEIISLVLTKNNLLDQYNSRQFSVTGAGAVCYRSRPQVTDSGTSIRYGGQLRYKLVCYVSTESNE